MTNPTSKSLIVICGPSGSGKSTLLKRLLAENGNKLAFTISHTTRKPRQGEVDGREYHFISRQEFEDMIANNQFVEHTNFSGNLYGTSKMAILEALDSSKVPIIEVDIEGVKALSSIEALKLKLIFIKPPSKEILMKRLSSRGTETVEALGRRLSRADDEIKFVEDGSIHFDLILVNDCLDGAYTKLKSFLNL